MKNPKLILAVCSLLVLTKCKKAETTMTKPPIEIVITHIPLDARLKPYYNFSDDSYWIYSDSTGAVVDSVYIKDFRITQDSSGTYYPKTGINIHQSVHYTLTGSTDVLYVTIRASTIQVVRNFSNNYKYSYLYYNPDATGCSPRSSRAYCKTQKDSLILKNGSTFKNCTLILYSASGDIRHFTTPSVHAEAAWVPGIGIVRVNSIIVPKVYHELLRYKVNPR